MKKTVTLITACMLLINVCFLTIPSSSYAHGGYMTDTVTGKVVFCIIVIPWLAWEAIKYPFHKISDGYHWLTLPKCPVCHQKTDSYYIEYYKMCLKCYSATKDTSTNER